MLPQNPRPRSSVGVEFLYSGGARRAAVQTDLGGPDTGVQLPRRVYASDEVGRTGSDRYYSVVFRWLR